MAVRRIVNARQMMAARMIVDGQSAYRALRAAGYSHWTARNFGALLRSSWGLREAIRQEQESRHHYLRPGPARRRRYDRGPVANAVRDYCLPEDRGAVSNSSVRWLYEQERKCRAIKEGKLTLPVHCSVCGRRTEGNDHWCPNCQRIERI
jgi:hypothetical protein